MSLRDRITTDMKSALKAQDKLRLSTLRLTAARTALALASSDRRLRCCHTAAQLSHRCALALCNSALRTRAWTLACLALCLVYWYVSALAAQRTCDLRVTSVSAVETSPTLDCSVMVSLQMHGYCSCAAVVFASAVYVCGVCVRKRNGSPTRGCPDRIGRSPDATIGASPWASRFPAAGSSPRWTA